MNKDGMFISSSTSEAASPTTSARVRLTSGGLFVGGGNVTLSGLAGNTLALTPSGINGSGFVLNSTGLALTGASIDLSSGGFIKVRGSAEDTFTKLSSSGLSVWSSGARALEISDNLNYTDTMINQEFLGQKGIYIGEGGTFYCENGKIKASTIVANYLYSKSDADMTANISQVSIKTMTRYTEQVDSGQSLAIGEIQFRDYLDSPTSTLIGCIRGIPAYKGADSGNDYPKTMDYLSPHHVFGNSSVMSDSLNTLKASASFVVEAGYSTFLDVMVDNCIRLIPGKDQGDINITCSIWYNESDKQLKAQRYKLSTKEYLGDPVNLASF
jgi:hypothetical protein